jgi:AraC family transcriptional regulator
VRRRAIPASLAQVLPALIHIQANLDRDLSLDQLAGEVQLSKSHFHRRFQRVTGETPKASFERLRLERAALHLRLRRASVLEIALECGYRNHETFTRAFRAHFGLTPRDHRRQWSRRPDAGSDRIPCADPRLATLAPTRRVRLKRLWVAFIRHLGPYEHVSLDTFTRLTAWARRRGTAGDTPILLGIAHDAPGVTPAAKIRFDCCIQVPEALAAEEDMGCQRTPAGDYAVTDYVGSWDLGPAYATILDRLQSNTAIDIIGLPAIEIFQTTPIGRAHGLAQVSIAIPVGVRRLVSQP